MSVWRRCPDGGENFVFGKDARGDVALLKNLARESHFTLKVFTVSKSHGEPVSSTLIRRLIARGKLLRAQRLIARPVSVLGTVIRGDGRGRGLGFPTANIDPHHEVLPPSGIYAVRVILGGAMLNGVCYIGKRPTVFPAGLPERSIEVYIFHFHKSIYGEDLEILFHQKIRGDKKFPTIKALVIQMEKDVSRAQKLLKGICSTYRQYRYPSSLIPNKQIKALHS